MPLIGLGCWQSSPADAKRSVAYALDNGYHLIDGARVYGNERAVGEALKSRPRDSFCIVSKLAWKEHGDVEECLRDTLACLGLDYIDLFLIHNPIGKQVVSTWKNMLRVRDLGLTRAVGVSNFGWQQLEGLKDTGLELPEVNQIEINVFQHQKEHIAWCRKEGIAIMAYSPLALGKRFGELGGKTKDEEASWMIRWCMDQGFITIPKSIHEARIKQNLETTRKPLTAQKRAELDAKHDGFSVFGTGTDGFASYMCKPWDEVK